MLFKESGVKSRLIEEVLITKTIAQSQQSSKKDLNLTVI